MILLACEGNSEVFLLQRLLKGGFLRFSASDVVDGRPLHLRQLTPYMPLINALPFDEPLEIYRVGDTQNDELSLKPLSARCAAGFVSVRRFCTKPEIEVLLILALNLYAAYSRSRQRPKSFLRSKYANLGFRDLLDNVDDDSLLGAILEYRRIRKHSQSEGYLADLLRNQP